jgi:hypothetical protein
MPHVRGRWRCWHAVHTDHASTGHGVLWRVSVCVLRSMCVVVALHLRASHSPRDHAYGFIV